MRVTVTHEQWPLARPFRISYQTIDSIDVLVAEVDDGTSVGRGEGVPFDRFEGPIAHSLEMAHAAADAVRGGATRTDLLERVPASAGRNALDCALWDLEARRSGVAAWRLAGAPHFHPLPVTYTVGIDERDELAAGAPAADEPGRG